MKAVFRDSELLRGTVYGAVYERENRSEPYVEIPPALLITDESGGMWTLGTEYIQHNGQLEFNVLRNDIDMGETASRIVYRGGKVTIFGRDGWRRWSGTTFI